MILINNNYDISNKSFIRVGGIVKEYIECDDVFQIKKELENKEFIALGNTSKILFAFKKSNLRFVKFINNKIVFFKDSFFVYSGASLNYVNHILMKKNITGFEFLSTIPGSIGGSIVNNSSFLEQCISDRLIKILVYENNKIYFIDRKDIYFSYRKSSLRKDNFLILGAYFMVEYKKKSELVLNFKKANDYRKKYQDCHKNTLGSTFKNVDNYKIGKILDELNYKGYVYNKNIKISDVHSNFILVKPYTNYNEINNFINFLKLLLYNYIRKEIEEEIQIIDYDGRRN